MCREHLRQHADAKHDVYPLKAFGRAKEGLQELHRYETFFREIYADVKEEKKKVIQEKNKFDLFFAQIEEKMLKIREYAESLEGKISGFSRLEAILEKMKYQTDPRDQIREFLLQNRIFPDGNSTISDKLSEFSSPSYTVDLPSALSSLSLSPVPVSETLETSSISAIRLLSIASNEIITNTSGVLTKESSLCVVSSRKLFACGPTKSACYITETGCEEIKEEMMEPRKHHGLVLLNDRVYAFAGVKGKSKDVKTWESFTIATGSWEKVGKMRPRRFTNPAVIKGKIYLAGGFADNPLEEFDPVTGNFRIIDNFPSIRHLGVGLAFNDCLVVLSHQGITRCNEDFSKFMNIFPGMPASRQMFSVVAPVWDGEAYYLLLTEGNKHVTVAVRDTATWEPEVREVA